MKVPTHRTALWLTAAAALAAPVSAEVYLTESQALGVIFGDKAIVRREQKVLDEALRKKLEHASNLQFPESGCTFFIGAKDGKPAKYAIVMNEIGKSEPITFMVGMSPDGKVTEVVIMEFRENRGWEVKEKRFLNQFRGKSARNSIRVDEDIINYTGATLSSKAVARGVKKALLLLDAFYSGESRLKLGVARDFSLSTAAGPIASASGAKEELGLFRQVRYAMGTHCEIRVWCATSSEAQIFFEEGFRELGRLEQIFSAYREDSELSEVNRKASTGAVQVSDDFFHVTREAMRHSRESNGLIDVTIGPLLSAWGLGSTETRIPDKTEIAAAMTLVGSHNVTLDPSRNSLRFCRPGMALDFGGIAKGYAAQRVANRLEKLGVPSALINLGRSSFYASQLHSDLQKRGANRELPQQSGQWPIAITHPDGEGAPPRYFYLRAGTALSTSGTAERKQSVGKREFSHIINPLTAGPLEGICSSTVVAEDGIFCEAASKQLLLLASAQREEWSRNHSNVAWVHYEVGLGGELFEHSSNAG